MSIIKRLSSAAGGYLAEQLAQRGHYAAPPTTPYARMVPPPGAVPPSGSTPDPDDPASAPSPDPATPRPRKDRGGDRLVAAKAAAPGDPDDDPDADGPPVTRLPGRRPPRQEEFHTPPRRKRKLRGKFRWLIAIGLLVLILYIVSSCFGGGTTVVKSPIAIAPQATATTVRVPAKLVESFNQLPSVYTEEDRVQFISTELQILDSLAVQAKVVGKPQSTSLGVTDQDTGECPAGNVDSRLYNIRYCSTDGTFWVSDQPEARLHDKIVRDLQANRFPMLADLIGAYARYTIEGDRGLAQVTGGDKISPSNWHCTVGQVTGAVKRHYKISEQEMTQITTGFSANAKEAFETGFKKGRCTVVGQQ
jgi:hypothetical protein